MSDILSYARLLALGLATGVIAQVVNTMGTLFGGGIVGLIALTVIFLSAEKLSILNWRISKDCYDLQSLGRKKARDRKSENNADTD